MTIDEAIKKHCEEAIRQESIANGAKHLGVSRESIEHCEQCATDNRQLAAWLTELKELRNSIGAVKLKDMKDAVGLLQELNTENDQLTSQLADAKRLLKLAVDDLHYLESHTVDEEGRCLISDRGERILCSDCPFNNGGKVNEKCVWNYEDEALKLLNDEK